MAKISETLIGDGYRKNSPTFTNGEFKPQTGTLSGDPDVQRNIDALIPPSAQKPYWTASEQAKVAKEAMDWQSMQRGNFVSEPVNPSPLPRGMLTGNVWSATQIENAYLGQYPDIARIVESARQAKK
jgi:hypothetical protein